MNLEVKHISTTLARKEIVKDVSLQVEKGRFVGLIGPNGSGKSTLLKTLYKALPAQGGTVFLDECDVLGSSPKAVAKHMAVVGQFNELDFDFTVREMVMMGRTPHKALLEADTKEDFVIVDAALRQVDLHSYGERNYSSLSGGEKQRVILARAVAQQPEFLILDEPTNHLDIRYQLQILSIVKKLGIGVLAALHDLTLAADYCDYLYVLDRGSVVAHGEPPAVLTKELIEEIYGVRCETYPNPVTGKFAVAYFAD
ncbi:iron complex transport system ATP-binding protein [Desulfitobacterium sp. LBE]|uniref:ABC transporter ATP-binding protein n=1 Tax=Desulfitobacterium sp. LBE TaxID=884086 RepID=UPI00119C3AD3|nr:ABC transporter ATP-binding protein [Desulfitobacterium sp. LBE]TWH57135.1 iron complex transport system ATP-binding protein [Desulfitobacterium sp. LBE]